MIELTLDGDIKDVAKSGSTIILKDDKTYEIKQEFAGYKDFAQCVSENKDKGDPNAYCGSIKHKVEDTKKEWDERIEKYLSIDKEQAWQILNKFYINGHLDSYKVLKEFLNKTAICPNVGDKFDELMTKWMTEGEADTSALEKIINSCKSEKNTDK